ncbi:uncharacterized protein LOC132178373 [Corylus avellana]|uniref:uncharacterized protein LOC132178373 n=1 Tax=Corylus avellana TaxID=13451 RepID=UPI00286BC9EB|nr:uncharacterized protein LOC132178373 [Corylus avellana]
MDSQSDSLMSDDGRPHGNSDIPIGHHMHKLVSTKTMKDMCKKTHSFMIIILLLQQLSPFDHKVAATQNNIDDDDDEHGQCGSSVGELQTESERCRRFLGTKKYISPGALKADQPACGIVVRGEPYSNSCLPPQANRPNRGCNKYYRCRK